MSSNTKAKVLVTGGAGFIGSHVVEALTPKYAVNVIDSLVSGKKTHLHPDAVFFQQDICDQKAVQEIFAQVKPEYVIHLAAQTSVPVSVENPQYDAQVNTLGLLNVLKAARQTSLKKIIFASSAAVYGSGQGQTLPFTEETPTSPISPYGVTKLTGEKYLEYYYQVHGIPYVALRYANVYGPRQSTSKESGVVPIFLEKMIHDEVVPIYGGGSNSRDYVFVKDVAQANLCALESDQVGVFNVSTGVATTTQQVYEVIAAAVKKTPQSQYLPERPGEVAHSLLSPQKATKCLHWQPTTSLEEGIRLTVTENFRPKK